MAEEEVMKVQEVTPQEELLEKQIREKLEVEYQKKLELQVQEISKTMQESNTKTLTEALEKYRKEIAPPSEEDIKKLLSQEYEEFELEIMPLRERVNGEKKKRTFIIRELPQSIEAKMVHKIKTILQPHAADLASLSMQLVEGDAAKKIVQVMNSFTPMLEVMCGLCTLSLNPFGEEEGVDEKWVADNIGSARIAKIVTAQMQCNKVRDFLSLLFQGTRFGT